MIFRSLALLAALILLAACTDPARARPGPAPDPSPADCTLTAGEIGCSPQGRP